MSSPTDPVRRLIAQAIAMHEVVAASLGINATDLRCLELLEEEPALTPSRLAELAGLTTGAVTGVLDRLEAAGFVRRESDTADRRRIIVRLVPERMADVGTAYRPLLERAADLGRPDGTRKLVEGLLAAIGAESDRLRVATEGGWIGDAYQAPSADLTRARLRLVTGAPRLNIAGAGFGQQVRMVAETAATRLRVAAGPALGELIRATFIGPPPDVRNTDGLVAMRYRRRMLDPRAREIDARINPSPAWSLAVDGGITDLDADLRGVSFVGLEVRGGANHVSLRLPVPNGTVHIALAGGSSDVRITRPAGTPFAVSARGGVADLRLDEIRRKASAVDLRVETERYAATPDRYELELAGGVARLTVRED